MRIQKAETSAAAALAEVRAADERASAAENAKIQLSMQLAELDDRRSAAAADADSPADASEEQFARSIITRRVATAERECEELREGLRAAEAEVKRLEFQVAVLSTLACP